eukprot:6753757-Pyramimonas_sp.AAC.1
MACTPCLPSRQGGDLCAPSRDRTGDYQAPSRDRAGGLHTPSRDRTGGLNQRQAGLISSSATTPSVASRTSPQQAYLRELQRQLYRDSSHKTIHLRLRA